MTITLNMEHIAEQIAVLDIHGVRVQDIDEIPPEAASINGPVLFPDPGSFVSNLSVTRDAWWSGNTSILTVEYDLTYILAYAPVGSGRGAFELYSQMVNAWVETVQTILGSDAIYDRCTLSLNGVPIFGQLQDPSGAPFWGSQITVHVSEQIN